MWLGRWREGQNLILLHHCEGAPGPVPGEIFAVQKLQAILGGSGISLPLKNYNSLHITITHFYQSPALTPGFLMALTNGLVKCWWTIGSFVSFWRSSYAAPDITPNSGESG